MYKIERKKANTVQLLLGDEVLTIKLGGIDQYKKYIEAQGRLLEIQKKIEHMEKSGKTAMPSDLLSYLGDTVTYTLEVVLGKENTQKIIDFFEGEFEEMLVAIMPFLNKEVLPKLKSVVQTESAELARQIADVSR